MGSLQEQLSAKLAEKASKAPSAEPVYFKLKSTEDQQYFYPKGSPGINISDPITVGGAFKAFGFWNRYDLVAELEAFIKSKGGTAAEGATAAWKAEEGQIARLGERGKFDWIGKRFLTGCPALPQGAGTLTVHRGSAVAFLLSLVGHALTGIVMLPNSDIKHAVVRPKIFLVPIQPSISNKGSVYPVRPHLKGDPSHENLTTVYKTTLAPITHQQSGGGAASHTQLSEAIRSNEKYATLSQEKGNFIGFTLVKGDGTKGIGNRYGFTSASSNTHAFPAFGGTQHTNCTTEEWGRYISLACDQLLKLEAHNPHRSLVLSGNKEAWRDVKAIYWPCELPKVLVAEEMEKPKKDVEDEWETD